ncbi:unnamed protein product [Brassica rapa]|uniref:Uncharacterized protein n=1 Tax=Brassica campestris TaxID=3711 RepID=A0A8D9D844_BRACM|nr:unnamed protein product [Brassica rapa]
MCTDGQQQTSYSPRGPKSPKQSTGRVSVLSPRTNVLICVVMDSHRRPVCADGHTHTHTDVLCVLTDTHGHKRTQPTWAKITRTVHGKGQHAESKDHRDDMCTDGQPRTSCVARVLSPRTNVLICVLMNSHGRPVCADGHSRAHTESHGRPVQPTWAKITRTVHGKGQHAESKDQRADMCTDGQPRTSCVPRGPKSPELSTGRVSMLSPRTNVLICVLMDSHRCPVCADGHTQTHTHSNGRPVQPTWAKITRTVHGKGQHAESKDQRADMCTDGQPRTSCVHERPVCANGHTRTATDVLCVLADTHGRPVCTEQTAHPHTPCVCWRTPTDVLCVLNRQPTLAKITQTVHGKGQRAESKDERAHMCTDGQPQTSCVQTRTATAVLCVLTDTHTCPVCADGHPQTSSTDVPSMDVLCVLADTHKRPVCTELTAHVGQNHPNHPREGSAC